MSLHGFPGDHEAYVTRQELAEFMGVSLRTVDTFLSEGMPHERWGMRAVRFKPSRAVAWARARGR